MRSAVGNRVTARLQSGYLYTYALVMLLGLIGAASWAIWWAQVSGLPLLSHPDRACRWSRACCACSSSANGARWIALIATLARPRARHLPVGAITIPTARNGSSSRMSPLGGGISWALGHRRHRAVADRAHRLPDADLHRRQLARDREARARIYGRFPADGGADASASSRRRTCSCSTSSSRAA